MSATTLVSDLVDSYNDRRLRDVAARYAAGATVHPAGWLEAVAVDGWIDAFHSMLESFPDLSIHPVHVTAGAGVAILEARLIGTNSGPFHLGAVDRLVLGTEADRLPPTGRTMDITGTVVLEMDQDRVTHERHYWPVVDTLVQLGLVAPDPVRT